ncbi:MAG: hypothetical protein ACFCUV_12860 [Rivularia sp. (in: cyanobacteria)]
MGGWGKVRSHLSSRRQILRLPMLELRNDKREVVKMDYLIADLWQFQKYAPAFRSDGGLLAELVNLVDKITNNQEYGIFDCKNGVIL